MCSKMTNLSKGKILTVARCDDDKKRNEALLDKQTCFNL